jgi:ribosomal protein L23
MIHRAIVDLYKVTPRKIGITQTPSKNVFSRGKNGVQKGVKKAYVYLKKGEKIELI